ncbi:MAG TPA: LuxR C-terminal-related transcriptional regulator [Kineosporiaceae bacterium]|nr:LuxR C-terminal-related transcriptional regulator [Kineosporiaceae bacterium]
MRQQLAQLAVEAATMIARGEDEVFDLVAQRTYELFGADGGVGFARWRVEDDGSTLLKVSPGGVPRFEQAWLDRALDLAPRTPSMLLLEQAGVREPLRVSDHLEMPRFWGTEEFAVMHGLYDGRYPVGVAVVHQPDEIAFIGLHRIKHDFDDDDLADLRQLQRVLTQAFAFRRTLDETVRDLMGRRPKRTAVLPWLRPLMEEYTPTRREAEVLALMVNGWTNQQIATRLGISERTVRKHLGAVYEQAGLAGRAAAAAWWHGRGPAMS